MSSVRRDRQLGMVWWPDYPDRHRVATLDEVERVKAGICPFCERGPFIVVATHVSKIHGMDRLELREFLGITFSASICDPHHAEACQKREREKIKSGLHQLVSEPARPRAPGKRLSSAAKRALARNGAKGNAAALESIAARTAIRYPTIIAMWDQGLTQRQIADRLGLVTTKAVQLALDRHGRDRSESRERARRLQQSQLPTGGW